MKKSKAETRWGTIHVNYMLMYSISMSERISSHIKYTNVTEKDTVAPCGSPRDHTGQSGQASSCSCNEFGAEWSRSQGDEVPKLELN